MNNLLSNCKIMVIVLLESDKWEYGNKWENKGNRKTFSKSFQFSWSINKKILYIIKQKCTTASRIKFGVGASIINKNIIAQWMTTKKSLSSPSKLNSSESLLKDIRHNTKRIFTSGQKALIVMKGSCGE